MAQVMTEKLRREQAYLRKRRDARERMDAAARIQHAFDRANARKRAAHRNAG